MLPIEGRIQSRLSGVDDLEPEQVVEVGGQAELVAVDEAPHQHRDDAGHRVGQEDRDPEEARAVQPGAVDRERGHQGEHEHDRHLHEEEQRDPAEAPPRTSASPKSST